MVNLLSKLGVESRLQALILAIKHGAVCLELGSPLSPVQSQPSKVKRYQG
jgi:hypothetical protein